MKYQEKVLSTVTAANDRTRRHPRPCYLHFCWTKRISLVLDSVSIIWFDDDRGIEYQLLGMEINLLINWWIEYFALYVRIVNVKNTQLNWCTTNTLNIHLLESFLTRKKFDRRENRYWKRPYQSKTLVRWHNSRRERIVGICWLSFTTIDLLDMLLQMCASHACWTTWIVHFTWWKDLFSSWEILVNL